MKKFEQLNLKSNTSNNFYKNSLIEKEDFPKTFKSKKEEIIQEFTMLSNEFNNFYKNFNNKRIVESLKPKQDSLTHKRNKSENIKNNILHLVADQDKSNGFNKLSKNEIKEKEYSGRKELQNEIMKKIFEKESGEIIDFLRVNNDHSKKTINDNNSDKNNNKKSIKNFANANLNISNNSNQNNSNSNINNLNIFNNHNNNYKKITNSFNSNKHLNLMMSNSNKQKLNDLDFFGKTANNTNKTKDMIFCLKKSPNNSTKIIPIISNLNNNNHDNNSEADNFSKANKSQSNFTNKNKRFQSIEISEIDKDYMNKYPFSPIIDTNDFNKTSKINSKDRFSIKEKDKENENENEKYNDNDNENDNNKEKEIDPYISVSKFDDRFKIKEKRKKIFSNNISFNQNNLKIICESQLSYYRTNINNNNDNNHYDKEKIENKKNNDEFKPNYNDYNNNLLISPNPSKNHFNKFSNSSPRKIDFNRFKKYNSFLITQNPNQTNRVKEFGRSYSVFAGNNSIRNGFYEENKNINSSFGDKSINNFHNDKDIDKEKDKNTKQSNIVDKILLNKKGDYYCPNCEHCNFLSDENLEKHLKLKEVKEIIKKSLDFILLNFNTDENYMDFMFNQKNENMINTIKTININKTFDKKKSSINNNDKDDINSNEIPNEKNKDKDKNSFNIETVFKNFPKVTQDRGTWKILVHFLDALLDDKVSCDYITNDENYEKLKDSLIMQGVAFSKKDGIITFDKELEQMFDQETIEKIKKLFGSKNILTKICINFTKKNIY
jgi:hypothetical protein